MNAITKPNLKYRYYSLVYIFCFNIQEKNILLGKNKMPKKYFYSIFSKFL